MVVVLIFLIILYVWLKFVRPKILEGFSEFPCRAILTDKQWTENMIKHHEMGLNMSVIYLPKTISPLLANVIREVIRTHEIELFLLRAHLKNNFTNVSHIEHINEAYRPSVMSSIFPNKVELSAVFCDPAYFSGHGSGHGSGHSAMVHSDLGYIQHMIPHHIVAIDMSKMLLKHTKKDFLIDLCNQIIVNQEYENIHLNALSKSM